LIVPLPPELELADDPALDDDPVLDAGPPLELVPDDDPLLPQAATTAAQTPNRTATNNVRPPVRIRLIKHFLSWTTNQIILTVGW
jgi:hypothetical protein